MQPRIIINLQENEYQALLNASERDYRPLRLHAEMIFRDALIERGIIKAPESPVTKQIEKNSKQRDQSPHAQPT